MYNVYIYIMYNVFRSHFGSRRHHSGTVEAIYNMSSWTSPEKTWKSTRSCSVKRSAWGKADAEALANAFYEHLPAAAQQLLFNGLFKGCSLVKLGDAVESSKDLKANACWLKGVLSVVSDRVPSGYLVADALILLDLKVAGKLLHPVLGQSKAELAIIEASKIKRLLGHLRHLWRNADGSWDETIQELKALVKKAPRCAESSSASVSEPPSAEKQRGFRLGLAGLTGDLPDSLPDNLSDTVPDKLPDNLNEEDQACDELFEHTSEMLGLAHDPNHLRYHAPSAFQNSMKTPEPKHPPFADDVIDTLTAQPMPPVDPLKQTKQVRLKKLKQNKKRKGTFGKKKKGKKAGPAHPAALVPPPPVPPPTSPPPASPVEVLPNGFYTIPMDMPQEAFIVPHRTATALVQHSNPENFPSTPAYPANQIITRVPNHICECPIGFWVSIHV
jgi:hypothetical protein